MDKIHETTSIPQQPAAIMTPPGWLEAAPSLESSFAASSSNIYIIVISVMITDEGEIQMGLEVFYDLFQLFLFEEL